MPDLDDEQRQALKKLRSGKILYADTGVGKSRTALAWYYFENGGYVGESFGDKDFKHMNNPPKDLYIITTAKKRDGKDWELEMAPFLMTPDKGTSIYNHTIKIDSWNNIGKYIRVKGAYFIFDEQRIVGKGKWVNSFLEIVKHNKWILLSATPGDKWCDYIPVFIANGFFRSRGEFNRNHVVYNSYITKYPKIEGYKNEGILLRYKNSILVPMRLEKEAVKCHHDVYVGYNRYLYNKTFKDRWDVYEDRPIEESGKLLFLVRKVVNSDPSRLDAVEILMRTHPRVIIFYNFDFELILLRSLVSLLGCELGEWNGSVHEECPKGDRWVYLVQYTAGCEGWNCITTNVIIFYSLNYSYKKTIQAEGRIDRRNTPYKELHYYYLQSRSGIDLAIKQALKNKEEFNERTFIK